MYKHNLKTKILNFCEVKSSRLLTFVSYDLGLYIQRMNFGENYEFNFSEKLRAVSCL